MPPPADAVTISPVTGWTVAAAPPDCVPTPAGLDELAWLPARVPGTVAGALRDAGKWVPGDARDLDAEDWWFRAALPRTSVADDEELVLCLGGIATLAETFIDGQPVLQSDSMFARHEIDITHRWPKGAELAIRCRALAPVLAMPKRPRARWRPRVAAGGLRHQRTMLLGRCPGFAASPAAVGPWRGVAVHRRRHIAVNDVRLRARLNRGNGRLSVTARLRQLGTERISSITVEVTGPSGIHGGPLVLSWAAGEVTATGEVEIPDVALWWPHTHGEPNLHGVHLRVATDVGVVELGAGRVGFRELLPGPPGNDVESGGLDLRVNGVRVFARGAVWTPLDLVGMAPGEAALRSALLRVRDAGMNVVRVVGLGAYESPAFHDLCDELGLLVWQDFMFANFDYPVADDAFRQSVEAEARTVLADLSWRPSLAVVCGNSEVEQQAAMLGLPPAAGRGELFGELLPRLVQQAGVDTPYVPSSPCGGDLPFRTSQGIAHYFGVGGYHRPLSDVRAAGVHFAAECLALANLPDDPELADVGVPRDVGATWDFADVRDHYTALLYGLDVAALRARDPARYRELGRATSGEVMAAVFGEWRREASPCRGGLVLWLTDLEPGSGWGVLDCHGNPKVAYHHLRRALAPAAVWLTDEGLGGLDLHVANDRGEPLRARLRVALYRDGEVLIEEAHEELDVAGHGYVNRGVEEMLGRFVDASHAYRFGPAEADVVVASLERETRGLTTLISQAFCFPTSHPSSVETPERLGLCAAARQACDGPEVTVRSRRLAYGVRLHVAGYESDDDAFSVEPGGSRTVRLRATGGANSPVVDGWVSAVNLAGHVEIDWTDVR